MKTGCRFLGEVDALSPDRKRERPCGGESLHYVLGRRPTAQDEEQGGERCQTQNEQAGEHGQPGPRATGSIGHRPETEPRPGSDEKDLDLAFDRWFKYGALRYDDTDAGRFSLVGFMLDDNLDVTVESVEEPKQTICGETFQPATL